MKSFYRDLSTAISGLGVTCGSRELIQGSTSKRWKLDSRDDCGDGEG